MKFDKDGRRIKYFINRWSYKKIINEDQKRLMLKDLDEELSSTSHFFRLIAVIGSLFIGFGLVLIIANNWEFLSRFVKLVLILLMPVSGFCLGYFLSYVKKDYKKIGDSFIFLATLFIGVSLILLAVLYDLRNFETELLFVWFVFSILVLLKFKFKILSFLSTFLLYLTFLTFLFKTSFFVFERFIFLFFFCFSILILFFSQFLRNNVFKKYSNLFEVSQIVSVKFLFFSLFLSTFNDDFYFLGNSMFSAFLQNILFLFVVFLVMWFSNKENNIILRNSTFFWIGLFMISKYFLWFWDSLENGIFFLGFGLFLIFLVFLYIKIIHNFKRKIIK